MLKTTLLCTGALVSLVSFPLVASAQMFGNRTLGRPITRPTQRGGVGQAQATENVGQFQGNERFVRGNRTARDFVGSDALERRTFVGQQGAAVQGPVISAIRDLRPQREVNLNQAMRKLSTRQMYNPRLQVQFDFERTSGEVLSDRIMTQLQRTETLTWTSPIEVSVADGTATLRGMVASARDREMAEQLVRFEPGISAVKNDLVVGSPSLPPPPSPSDRPQ